MQVQACYMHATNHATPSIHAILQLLPTMQACKSRHAMPCMPCNHASTPMQSYKSNMQPCNHATPIASMQPCKSKQSVPCNHANPSMPCNHASQTCNHATPSIHATMQVQACHAMQPCKSKHACHACHAIMQSKHARHAIIKSMHGMHENPSMPHACKTMHAALAPFSMPCARNKNISNLQEKTVCYPEPFPADTKRDS